MMRWGIVQQLQALRHSHPASWPHLSQSLLLLAIFSGILVLGWQVQLGPIVASLESSQKEEQALKTSYAAKYAKAIGLPWLQTREEQLRRDIDALEDGFSEEDDISGLLSDIAVAAERHQLQFDFAKPGKPETGKYDVTQPIAIRLTGRYHDIGRFAADLSTMPHMLRLDNIQLNATDRPGAIIMEADVVAHHRLQAEEKS